MITIFCGRKLSLDGSEDVIYAQVAVALRDQIHHFNTGRNCNPFAVFIKIALHTDQYGWAFPSSASISAGTGISTAHALAAARTHLLNVRIDGHRVLAIYRQRRPDGTFGRHLYRIFPDAWPAALDHLPHGFAPDSLSPLTPDPACDPAGHGPPAAVPLVAGPSAGHPHAAQPHVDQPHADDPHPKKNQLKKKNQISSKSRSGSAGIDRTNSHSGSDPPTPIERSTPWGPNLQSPISQSSGAPRRGPNPQSAHAAPPVRRQPPPRADSTAFTPCDLARFIAAHSGYHFPAGEQHDRLPRPVAHADGAYPAPDELFLDPTQREAFQAWVLEKIAWAERAGGPRKPLKALVSALRNYQHPHFGWFIFWKRWSGGGGAPYGGRTEGPGHASWPQDPAASAWENAYAGIHERHWEQVAAYLDRTPPPLERPQPRGAGPTPGRPSMPDLWP